MSPPETLAAVNHNPLNLRPLPSGEKWQGQTGVSTNSVSGKFCVFTDNAKGVRAAVINMRSIVRLGRNTLALMIHTWAPPSENDSDSYLRIVCQRSGLWSDYDLSWISTGAGSAGFTQAGFALLARIVAAMNTVEAGGETATEAEITDGIGQALGVPQGYERRDDGNIMRKDVDASTTVKVAENGMTQTGLVGAVGVAAPVVGIVAGASWEVALIITVACLVGLAGFAIYKLHVARAERLKMHDNGIA